MFQPFLIIRITSAEHEADGDEAAGVDECALDGGLGGPRVAAVVAQIRFSKNRRGGRVDNPLTRVNVKFAYYQL